MNPPYMLLFHIHVRCLGGDASSAVAEGLGVASVLLAAQDWHPVGLTKRCGHDHGHDDTWRLRIRLRALGK